MRALHAVSCLIRSLRHQDGGALFRIGARILGLPDLVVFVIYSFLGVVVETIFCLVMEGVLESRLGLLYLPLRPMYGVGGVACMLLLHRFMSEPILVFCSAC